MWIRVASFVTFGWSKRRVMTVGGWSPGLQSLVTGKVLPCGCLAGVYRTLSDEMAAIVDGPADTCSEGGHEQDGVLWRCRVEETECATDGDRVRKRYAMRMRPDQAAADYGPPLTGARRS